MSDLMQSMRLALKWESYADTVKRFYLIDKVKCESEYKAKMAELQAIIKGYAKEKKLKIIPAMTELANQFDGMSALKFLAAGYELITGNDFTKNEAK